MKRIYSVAAMALGVCAALVPAAASAQTTDKWEYGAIIYGWLPSIGGKTTFPAGTGSDIHISDQDLIDHLKFAFMGSFEARKNEWGVFTDVIYLSVGSGKSQTRDVTVGGLPLPGGVTADLNYNLKGTLWTIAGEYRAATTPTANVDVLAGARLVDVKQSLGWTFSTDLPIDHNPGRTGSKDADVSKWDAIVGAKGRIAISDDRTWFVPWYADIGTGQTDLTWQVLGGVGYAFKWGDVIAVWRYLDYNFKSGSPVEKLNFNGPAIGVAFHW